MYTVGMSSIQYTIRNIPPRVDQLLRGRAKKQGKSFNETLVEALERGAGVQPKSKIHRDLGWFYGSGGIDPEEEAAFAEQRQIDEELWR